MKTVELKKEETFDVALAEKRMLEIKSKNHNINDTYKIIETKKFNNDEGVKAWETYFYNVNDGGTCYSTFNDALICTMFGRFSNSAIVLFETMEKERKEQEEKEKEKKLSLTK